MIFNDCLQMKCDTSNPAFHFKVKNGLLKSAEPGALNREIPVSVMMTWSTAKQSIRTAMGQSHPGSTRHRETRNRLIFSGCFCFCHNSPFQKFLGILSRKHCKGPNPLHPGKDYTGKSPGCGFTSQVFVSSYGMLCNLCKLPEPCPSYMQMWWEH